MVTDNVKKVVNDYFNIKKETSEQIFRQIQLIVFQNETKDNDLYYLAKKLNPEDLDSLIDYFDGGNLRLPTKKQYRESLLVAIVFYLKDILGKDWKEIKDLIDVDDKKLISGVSIGKKISNLRQDIREKLTVLLKQLRPEDFISLASQDLDNE